MDLSGGVGCCGGVGRSAAGVGVGLGGSLTGASAVVVAGAGGGRVGLVVPWDGQQLRGRYLGCDDAGLSGVVLGAAPGAVGLSEPDPVSEQGQRRDCGRVASGRGVLVWAGRACSGAIANSYGYHDGHAVLAVLWVGVLVCLTYGWTFAAGVCFAVAYAVTWTTVMCGDRILRGWASVRAVGVSRRAAADRHLLADPSGR